MYACRLVVPLLLTLQLCASVTFAAETEKPRRAEVGEAPARAEPDLSPVERMSRRYPQKARVGDLLGLALQDEDDRVLGHVEQVVRTSEGSIVLVMTRHGWLGKSGRSVGIPLETVAILGRHINVLDLSREEVSALPVWASSRGAQLAPDEAIRIAISRR